MTITHSPISAPALTWTVVDDGVWVASHDGEFAGMAERTTATDFRLTDHVARDLGRFRSLAAAQTALGRPTSPGGSRRRPSRRRHELVSLLGGPAACSSAAAQHKEKTV
jgi:hypothetical protein